MNQLSEEQREPTIRTGGEDLSIFEIMQRYRNDGSCEYVIQDALRRLSLLDSDSQAARVAHRNYECMTTVADETLWCATCAAHAEYLRGRSDAATSMRDKCVEKVRAMGQQWYAEAKQRGAAFSDKGRLAETIAVELSSLTLDQVKPGEM